MASLATWSGAESTPGYGLVLASRSPRRRHLLEEAGIEADTIDPGIDDAELRPGSVPASIWVASLAFLKARSGLASRVWQTPVVVLGADTVCVCDGEVLGQPADEREAERMLRMFEGRAHQVLTGVALVASDQALREVFVDRSVVRFADLGDERRSAYLASGGWRGKAGGYNIAERLAEGWPIEFEGDETSIMGLPMRALGPRLASFARQALGSGAA